MADQNLDFNAKLEDARIMLKAIVDMQIAGSDYRQKPSLHRMRNWWSSIFTALDFLSPYMGNKEEVNNKTIFMNTIGIIINKRGRNTLRLADKATNTLWKIHRDLAVLKKEIGLGAKLREQDIDDDDEEDYTWKLGDSDNYKK